MSMPRLVLVAVALAVSAVLAVTTVSVAVLAVSAVLALLVFRRAAHACEIDLDCRELERRQSPR